MHNSDLTSEYLNAAVISNEQLSDLSRLWHATMPNGKRYDGRFNLWGDLEGIADKSDIEDPEFMAMIYAVSLEEYLAGQEWAEENLPGLRGDENIGNGP